MTKIKPPIKNIVRNVRLEDNLDTALRAISVYEDRTISSVIQRLLKLAVNIYLDNKPNFLDFCNEKLNLEDSRKISECIEPDRYLLS